MYFGDFNYPNINWNSLEADRKGSKFLEMIQNNFLIQHIDFRTRGENILDLLFSSEENMIENARAIGKLGNSDHDIISFDMNMYTERIDNSNMVPDYSKAKWEDLKRDLSKVNWEREFLNLDASQAWNKFKEILDLYTSKYIPMKKAKSRKRPLWMTRNAMRIIRKKSKLWKKYKESREYSDYLNYKMSERESKKEISKIKRDFEKKLVMDIKSNPKKFYSYVKSKSRTRDSIGPLKGSDGEPVTGDMEKCNILNNYFCSVFSKSNCPESDESGYVYEGELIDNLVIDEKTMRDKIDKLKEGKSPGPEGITPNILKRIRDAIVKPLVSICNRSLEQGIIPQDWRMANVAPIFKKGKKDESANYRPVSLTSVVCKLLESVIRDKMIKHLDKNRLLKLSQHGFMKGRSCLTNLLDFFEDVLENLDSGMPVDVIYFDFAKAFDKVSHSKLIGKLKKYGIGGNLYNGSKVG